MKQYLDTSVVVSFFINEIHTGTVRDWLKHDASNQNIISDWTFTEFHSALSLKLRTSQITSEIKTDAELFLKRAINTLFECVRVVDADFRRAAELSGRAELWLRAGDALNLAIAERESAVLCTLDKKLFEAGRKVGVAVRMP